MQLLLKDSNKHLQFLTHTYTEMSFVCSKILPDNLIVTTNELSGVIHLDCLSVEGVAGARLGSSVVTCKQGT